MQSTLQEKCSYTMAVRGLFDEGSVMVRRMMTFTSGMSRGSVSVEVAFATSSAPSLPGMSLWSKNRMAMAGRFPFV